MLLLSPWVVTRQAFRWGPSAAKIRRCHGCWRGRQQLWGLVSSSFGAAVACCSNAAADMTRGEPELVMGIAVIGSVIAGFVMGPYGYMTRIMFSGAEQVAVSLHVELVFFACRCPFRRVTREAHSDR